MIFNNENWYYLYLEDGSGGVVEVPPESSIDLPEYFLKYSGYFERQITPGTTYTVYNVGDAVYVFSNNEMLDRQPGVVIDKDNISYKIDLESLGMAIWFPYSEVAK